MAQVAKAIWTWIKTQFTPSNEAWRAATWSLFAFALVLISVNAAYSIATIFTVERLMGFGVVLAISLLSALGIMLISWLTSALPTAYRFAMLIAIPFAMMTGGVAWGVGGGLIFTALALTSLSFFFGSLAALRRGRLSFRRHWLTVSVFLLGAGGFSLLAYGLFLKESDLNQPLEGYTLADRTIDAANPGSPGAHEFVLMTYGSGADRHRPEYGEEVDLVSRSVDGSALVDRWSGPVGWARTRYWGFDATELPLQGRVWMPKGEGPFPLVLIVHGNHGMEDFSDPGYAYVGEHLASHGYILVSVDENFLNSSYADMLNPLEPGIGSENDARAWVLLEHLKLWREWMADRDHPLFGKADLTRIGLIGHSRGGEAVGHAAAFNKLKHYPDDATLEFDYGFDIGAVIAIAPSDRQYGPRGFRVPLEDINYFAIHGSLDGDVQSFMGASQWSRVKFSGKQQRFKASLYVEGANHGQFNTSWGRNDFGMPFGWFLDTGQIMDPVEQRDIARVYFTAFLEATLNARHEYRQIFQSPSYGAAWLPNRYYVSNFADSESAWLATFDEDLDPSTATWRDSEIATNNLSKWKESWIDLKWNELDTPVTIVAWDERVHDGVATYAVKFAPVPLDLFSASDLIFSVAQSAGGTLPKGFEPEEDEVEEGALDEQDDDEVEESKARILDWTIILTDSAGQSARLPLSHQAPLYPQVEARTRRAGFLEDIAMSEALLQYYAFPLADFVEQNPAFSPAQLAEIRFEFDQSPRGAVIFDDIGLR